MGFVLANPLAFAWTVEERDVAHGFYWALMFGYALLFGSFGPLYSLCGERGNVARARGA
jgi:hypothetical protein